MGMKVSGFMRVYEDNGVTIRCLELWDYYVVYRVLRKVTGLGPV